MFQYGMLSGGRLWVTNSRLSEANIEWLWPEPDCGTEKISITLPPNHVGSLTWLNP